MPQIIHQDGFDVGSQLPPPWLSGLKLKWEKQKTLETMKRILKNDINFLKLWQMCIFTT